jgi:hypothetical protein
MYYNSAMQEFRCYRDSSWDACGINPIDRGFSMSEEFIGGAYGSGTGTIGELGWTFGKSGTATGGPSSVVTPTGDRPGNFGISTGATSGSVGFLILTMANSGGGSPATTALGAFDTVKAAVVPTYTAQIGTRVGLMDTVTSSSPATGVWWQANTATSANWQYCYAGAAGAVSCADFAGATISTGSWATLGIRINALGAGTSKVTFTYNGSSITLSSITINTTSLVYPSFDCWSGTATSVSSTIDYFQYSGTTSALR